MKTPKPFSRNYPAYMEQKRKEAEALAAERKRESKEKKADEVAPPKEQPIDLGSSFDGFGKPAPAPQPEKREKKKRKNKWGSDVENREDKSFNEFDTK